MDDRDDSRAPVSESKLQSSKLPSSDIVSRTPTTRPGARRAALESKASEPSALAEREADLHPSTGKENIGPCAKR